MRAAPAGAAVLLALLASPAICQQVSDADSGATFHAGSWSFNLGGFIEAAGIYRNKEERADIGSDFNTGLPYLNSADSRTSQSRLSGRQSRISLLAEGPQDGANRLQAYLEADFIGAGFSDSDSYTPRLRQGYGVYTRADLGFSILCGEAWSLATLHEVGLEPRSEDVPLTIDAHYIVGFAWTRNTQLRFVERFSDAVSAGLSLETPQALIYNGPNALPGDTVFNGERGTLFSSGAGYSLDSAPDLIGKIALDPGFGHYEIYAMARWFRDGAAGATDTASAGAAGGGLVLPLVADLLDFHFSALAGKGIGRYSSAQLPDVTLSPSGQFVPISERHWMAGLSMRPADAWTLYGYFGDEHADKTDFIEPAGELGYGYGSPLYDNSGCLTLGSGRCAANTHYIDQGTAGCWWQYYQGALGKLQLGVQGSYTLRHIFVGLGGPGIGADPDAALKMLLVSFRYYPAG
jgi:hypothetical protein